MATITNKMKQTLYLTGEGWRYPLVPSGESIVITDEHAKNWMERAVSLVGSGGVVVKLDGQAPEAELGFRGLHWRAAITQVETMEDLDALAELHAAETRPKVLEVIEARMAVLQG
jgi:hypothetical protein